MQTMMERPASEVSDRPWRVELPEGSGEDSTWVEVDEDFSNLIAAWGFGRDQIRSDPFLFAPFLFDFRVMRVGKAYEFARWTCGSCKSRLNDRGMEPSHAGTERCESGSLASGGNRTHCSCDVCF